MPLQAYWEIRITRAPQRPTPCFLSSHPADGYEKTSQARDLASILDELTIGNVALVTHDIGNMVGYAFAAQFSHRVSKWVVMDAPLPGFGTWEKQLLSPKVLFAKVGKLQMPALAIGGDHSYGAAMKAELETVASDVHGAIIRDSGHWIMEEQPQQAVTIIVRFIREG